MATQDASPQFTRLARRELPKLPQAGRGMRNLPAWVISLLFHAAILVTAGTLWVAAPRGTGGEKDRPVGVAVVYNSGTSEEYFLSDTGDSSSSGSNGANSPESVLPNASSLNSDRLLNDLLPGASLASADPSSAAGTLGLGDGGAALGGDRSVPKVKTSVFGIEGEGTRFLYVFDRSDSMNGFGGLPLSAAKAELLESLESLGPAHQFQIIFYNDSPLPYGGLGGQGPQLLRGEEDTKLAAKRFVRDMVAVGGTRHIDALRMAVTMGPDVIFFLTDADRPAMPERLIEDLHVRSSRIGATIHAIQFGAGPNQTGGGWIRQLASGSSGQYRYVDVTRLGQSTE